MCLWTELHVRPLLEEKKYKNSILVLLYNILRDLSVNIRVLFLMRASQTFFWSSTVDIEEKYRWTFLLNKKTKITVRRSFGHFTSSIVCVNFPTLLADKKARQRGHPTPTDWKISSFIYKAKEDLWPRSGRWRGKNQSDCQHGSRFDIYFSSASIQESERWVSWISCVGSHLGNEITPLQLTCPQPTYTSLFIPYIPNTTGVFIFLLSPLLSTELSTF